MYLAYWCGRLTADFDGLRDSLRGGMSPLASAPVQPATIHSLNRALGYRINSWLSPRGAAVTHILQCRPQQNGYAARRPPAGSAHPPRRLLMLDAL